MGRWIVGDMFKHICQIKKYWLKGCVFALNKNRQGLKIDH